jgi:hypothetical protein
MNIKVLLNITATYISLQLSIYLGLEVFTAVNMTNAVFWNVTPCGFIINRRFGGTYRLIFRVEEITRARKRVRQ